MPVVQVEILRTRTVTIKESGVLEVRAPKDVIDNGDLHEWVENNVHEKDIERVMEMSDESEDIEIDEVNLLDGEE